MLSNVFTSGAPCEAQVISNNCIIYLVYCTLLCYNNRTIQKEVVFLSIGAMPSVRPISDLRQNMAEITKSIDTDKRPVILTKHGYGKYILLSIEEYNRIVAISELYTAIDAGIADVEAGRVSDFKEFAKQLREDMRNGRV